MRGSCEYVNGPRVHKDQFFGQLRNYETSKKDCDSWSYIKNSIHFGSKYSKLFPVSVNPDAEILQALSVAPASSMADHETEKSNSLTFTRRSVGLLALLIEVFVGS
jgi:hypothetical protein